MVAHSLRRALGAGALLSSFLISHLAFAAQEAANPSSPNPPELVITPNRTPQPLQRAGSAITVITADEIAASGHGSLSDILRGTPGLSIVETAGPGSNSSVFLRGTDPRHTLVLVDGVRVNDPSSTGGETDLGLLAAANVERIEILRGPQSAIYGSDAIGGVINIITKKGRGKPTITLRTEGSSYGTIGSRVSVSAGTDTLSYAFSGLAFHSDGFSRYGYRIRRLEASGPFEKDKTDRSAASGRVSWQASDWLSLETGFSSSQTRFGYDSAFGLLPDSPSQGTGQVDSLYGKLVADSFERRLKSTLTLFGARTERRYEDVSRYADFFTGDPTDGLSRSRYLGEQRGLEYQGDLKLDQLGLLTFGTRFEREQARASTTTLLPFDDFSITSNAQTTKSLFALHQITLGQRLHLSAGGRLDDVSSSGRFATWRATAAYEIPDSDTKLRASAGTGAKAPSLYQLYAPSYGNKNLRAETSTGFDAGVDQMLLDGRASLSVTAFTNALRNLITADAPAYLYYNIARASTKGIEIGASYKVIPDYATLKGAFTYLDTRDLSVGNPVSSGLPLFRRPRHEGRISLALTPLPNLTLEPIVRLVGARADITYDDVVGAQRVRLNPYLRFDMRADYRINDAFSVFARADNLTNARYEEVYNYGTAGRSFFGGMEVRW